MYLLLFLCDLLNFSVSLFKHFYLYIVYFSSSFTHLSITAPHCSPCMLPAFFSSTSSLFYCPYPCPFLLSFHINATLIVSLSTSCPVLTHSFLFHYAMGQYSLTLPPNCTMPGESPADRTANAQMPLKRS